MSSSSLLRAMYSEYGLSPKAATRCRTCCNLHFNPDDPHARVCIAYGYSKGEDCNWDPESVACGLYNRAFLGLRPRHRTILDMRHLRQGKAADTRDENQESIFPADPNRQ